MSKPPRKSEAENKKPHFNSLSEETNETLIDLLDLDPSVNPDEQEKATQALIQVTEVLRGYWRNLEGFESLPGRKSRGRPKQEVLQKAIGDLRRTFRQFSGKIDNRRKTTGAVISLSRSESEEREFIHLALKNADIPHPSLKKLRRSYHKQGTPLADRNKVIKNIEEEAERRRAKRSTSKGDESKK